MGTAGIDEKVQREKEFHNDWAKTVRLDELLVRESFEAPTAIENAYALRQLGDLKGKKLLDLGCGAGETSVYFALQGAEVYALDIADEFLKVAGMLAARHGVELHLICSAAGALPFPDGQFDLVFGNGVLHHVELIPTVQEVQRVLKKGGRAVFVEPLPYNPAINVYRQMARGVRTEDEKPLRFTQLRQIEPYFSSTHHEEFWLFSLLIFFHFYFVRRWDPSKVRYWKKVIEEGESYRRSFGILQKMDRWTMNVLPFLRPLCWNTVFVGIK